VASWNLFVRLTFSLSSFISMEKIFRGKKKERKKRKRSKIKEKEEKKKKKTFGWQVHIFRKVLNTRNDELFLLMNIVREKLVGLANLGDLRKRERGVENGLRNRKRKKEKKKNPPERCISN